MVKKASEMKSDVREQMRGGDGKVLMTSLLDKGEYDGQCRLVSTITLEKDCSIGKHIHENEEEIFYVVQGTAVYDDDGKEVVMHRGDVCVCKNGQSHSLGNRSDETLVVVAVILTL